MQKFSSSRLAFARQRRGMTMTELASAVDRSLKTVSAYENGDASPSEEMVRELSIVLDFPWKFFFEGPIELVDEASASFRKYASLTARQKHAVLASAELAWRFAEELEASFDLPSPVVPDLRGEDPQAAASAVRAAWGLGAAPIRNMLHLIESKGVRVFSLIEECHAVDAFCVWRGNTPVMYLNVTKSGERSRFDCAHELGHLVLHRHAENRGKQAEAEANTFASAFLMPRESVVVHAPWLPSMDRLVSMKRVWGVSVAALARRLKDLGLISRWQYEQAFVEISRRGWRHDEPRPIARERSLLFAKLMPQLRADGTGLRRLAEQLHVYPRELAGYTFGTEPVALEGEMATSPSRPPRAQLQLVPDEDA